MAKVQRGSLLHHAADVYSQRGDDGIIREIFRRLDLDRGSFVEFGAWDGLHHSNTRLLFEKGWSGMFIEGDPAKARHLKERYAASPDVICIEGFVHPVSGPDRKSLDDYCDDNGIDGIDFLSIDIDGLDLNVFENLRRRPKAVAIEGGFSWHPQMNVRVPDAVAARNLQQPLAIVVEAVRAKEYEPVCFNQNLYAVESGFAECFDGVKHDAESLWLDGYYIQSEAFRLNLSSFRRNHPLIREYETPYESGFTVDA
jgi:methyltransferase FkbM-like protein